MAGLDRKRRGELLKAVFGALADHPDGLRARDVFPEVERLVGMTDFEAANYPGSDVRRFEKTVRFVTINAVKAGWLVKEAGVWTATDAGLQANREIEDPEEFLLEAQRLYKAWEEKQPHQDEDLETVASEEELDSTSVTLERAEEASWEEVRAVLHQMDPYDFQDLVAGLLRGMGYFVNWIAPPGKDQGVDIVALGDSLGTKGPRVKVQVKRETRQDGSHHPPRLLLGSPRRRHWGLHHSRRFHCRRRG